MEKVLITYLDVKYMETHTSQSTLLHIQIFFLKIAVLPLVHLCPLAFNPGQQGEKRWPFQ